MANETKAPSAPVLQEPPDLLERMSNFLGQSDPDPGQVSDAPSATGESDSSQPVAAEGQDQVTDQLTPEDLPADPETEQSSPDAFEIVHNGTQVKLSRADTIKYAQQGFDYTQKTQALAQKVDLADARLRAVAQIEQMQPHLAQDYGVIASLSAQLAPYQNVDWVAVANQNPAAYPVERAKYDQLVNSYQNAVAQYQQKQQAVGQQFQALTAHKLQQEGARLKQLLPTFNDKTAADVRDYLLRVGVPAGAVENVNDANSVLIAYKAMQYDRLVESKQAKVKQLRTAPPVTRPGAVQTGAAATDKSQQLTARLRKSGSIEDAAALLADRWK